MTNLVDKPPATPEECPTHLPVSYFGANYPDSQCIEGYLWDEDSGEGDGFLYSGGDIPCPYCKPSEHMEYNRLDECAISCVVCNGPLTEYHWATTSKPSVKLHGHCSACDCNQWAVATPLEEE